ncbi:hypothetical protein HG535_0B00890 [Zygotorulaspora mrakii]|uniref:S-adenosyl-L-methionine-dependent tRNA 4-demethylwyosine synthase n=1 Tax=Zygotorulaspora mrakii TaxID=42260 RepID=A0A7H9AXN6_ZYGMR|nr:uncharacterized protein HG535_0B00890 [Zygotorulaspora mrakii]QLG71051.1 hypothetical protein HG535_0B00890 [Zygotorulaspora mrakii]
MALNWLTACGTLFCAGLYLWLGGRKSVAMAIVVFYGAVHLDSKIERVKSTADKFIENESSIDEEKPKKKKCCGGKGGSGCCSSKGNKKKGGCSCGHSKNADIEDIADSLESGLVVSTSQEKDTSSGEKSTSRETNAEKRDNIIAVDFTQAFKRLSKKKGKNGKDARPRKHITKASVLKKPKEEDDLVKSAMTVSNESLLSSQVYVFYSSLQGGAERSARKVLETLSRLIELKAPPILLNMDDITDIDDYFVSVPCENALYILVVPSYDTDCPLDYFLQTLEENFNDFRIDKFPLRKLVGYGILGIGDSETWPEKFCYQAKKVDHWIARLGGRRIFPVGEVCMKTEAESKVQEWADLLCETIKDDTPILYEYDEEVTSSNEDDRPEEDMIDLEDIGNSDISGNDTKQMVAKNSPTYKKLTKQGYTIVGSHSGVKICRWTKSDLRGTGSCYKHSLFNIVSSRCMELTPSLACSSKCVFCWRHGTNPVSKNWRWELDEPDYILENALQGHYSKIKQMRGVPGVVMERFAKAFKVRHCALSLVGEPIMYPYITKFIELLHEKQISSFLVCNAQHPDALASIGKVTQLYVSIDAPTKTELKKVDRPLFKDFWERMLQCLDILNSEQSHQRTVFRLTLVKGFNMADVSAYADLVQRGLPSFIEVKGATFSGSSDGNGNPLTMQNIPFYEECTKFVKEFAAELQRRGLGYGIAAEHAHSNCILIASTEFKINGEWHTHIDFDKFFELLASGKQFYPMDYVAKTPEWALFGNGGFAPGDTRVYRKGKKKRMMQSSEKESNETQA